MNLPLRYEDFLKAKVVMAPVGGFMVDDAAINPLLKPHQRDMVKWALRGGRRAIFAAFGLGKTFVQLELLRLCLLFGVPLGKTDLHGALICAPLGVRREFFRDAGVLMTGDDPNITEAQRADLVAWLDGHPERRIDLAFIRGVDEALPGRLHITNYETVRDGKLDPRQFVAASLDEASCLRGFGGTKTFREFMRLFDGLPFKFVATATPSPNEFIEMLAYSAFLEVMDVGQAKTRFFKRNSEEADKLTLHPHKVEEFWKWVASWGLFVQKPSDLGHPDDGYDLPGLAVRWHELPADHARAGEEKNGQKRLLRNAAASVIDASREKRDSLGIRVEKVGAIVGDLPAEEPVVVWCDLNDEQDALERVLASRKVSSLRGTQLIDEREGLLDDWRDGKTAIFLTKPMMYGSGVNLQRSHVMVFVGIGFKFQDFIQAVHRELRFGQRHPVEVHVIYTEAERPVRDALEAKWARHDAQMAVMTSIIREYGLNEAAMAQSLTRGMGVERIEASGTSYRLVNADCVEETRTMPPSSVDLVVTSIPFSTQYEYSPNYADFGHTDNDRHFWQQMDFLIPQLLRVLQPGRIAAIHVKDRIVPGGMTGLGFQTVAPFSDECTAAFRRHGFAFLARKTIVTDVVRENNQTYRLGWTEQCKDGSRMGAGMPEYLLIFRKPPSDSSNGYADVPVHKDKKEWDGKAWPEWEAGDVPFSSLDRGAENEHAPGAWSHPDGYSRARWQLDAHGFMKSDGNRLLMPEEIIGLDANVIYKLWKSRDAAGIYSFANHVGLCEALEEKGALPPTFMLLPPHTAHPDVWTEVTRMRTLNGAQHAAGREMHLCPLQFDIVDRAIEQYTMKGETVFDPFGGLMTVPFRALKLGRRGIGIELSPSYFADGVGYVEEAARDMAMPSLFDLMGIENEEKAE